LVFAKICGLSCALALMGLAVADAPFMSEGDTKKL